MTGGDDLRLAGASAFLTGAAGGIGRVVAALGRSRIVVNAGAHSGRPAPGCCVRTALPDGPATLIGLSPDARRPEGFVIAAAEGEITGSPKVALRVTATWFRTRTQPPEHAFDRWLLAGTTHHASLSPGHLAGVLAEVAAHAVLGFKEV
jgi:hypothetical protein